MGGGWTQHMQSGCILPPPWGVTVATRPWPAAQEVVAQHLHEAILPHLLLGAGRLPYVLQALRGAVGRAGEAETGRARVLIVFQA